MQACVRAACVGCHGDRFESSDVAAGANRREGNRDRDRDWGFRPVAILPFQFIARNDKNIRVKYTLCPGDTFLSTAAKSVSNLSKHLSAQHGNTKLVAKDPARRSSEGIDEQPTLPKQAMLFSSVGAQKQVTQKDINRLVAGFIVEDMLPLSTIVSPRFKKILDKIPATHKPMSDRKTFYIYIYIYFIFFLFAVNVITRWFCSQGKIFILMFPIVLKLVSCY